MGKYQDILFNILMIAFIIYLVGALFIQFKVLSNNEPIIIYKNSSITSESEKLADYLNRRRDHKYCFFSCYLLARVSDCVVFFWFAIETTHTHTPKHVKLWIYLRARVCTRS